MTITIPDLKTTRSYGKFLGRKIRVRRWGVEVEGDDELVKDLLEEFGANGKCTETPGLPGGNKVDEASPIEPVLVNSSEAAPLSTWRSKMELHCIG